ncbi:hypothetical protein PsYK624_053540 [Phanerochaete sordida]|uniref:Uncharacterized protein n=1 Tax=Phanerochaete sordida TaxID=48140 RepID=A0A9P3G6N0_9APHY|nr:hypothetical protein PsYK624_053540 [Phanerochaete sordida]
MSCGLGKAIRNIVPARVPACMAAAKAWGARVLATIGGRVPGFMGTAAKAFQGFFTRNWANIAMGIVSPSASSWRWRRSSRARSSSRRRSRKSGRWTRYSLALNHSLRRWASSRSLCRSFAFLARAAKTAAIAGALGIWPAGIVIIVAVVAVIVTLTEPRQDPIRKTLNKYGGIRISCSSSAPGHHARQRSSVHAVRDYGIVHVLYTAEMASGGTRTQTNRTTAS